WYRSELATMECLKKIAGHVVSIHYKDVNADKKDVPFGTGVNHAADQLAELKRQDFKGVITIEYEKWGAEQHSDLLQCVAFLNQTAAQLAP
ncbi:sugar phosphate isomerase/epimerase, partial [candidate division KSB1 bacterium]|nr:sugar phosphate isomerase/epimerase [candidate division KSB1 bacterium]